MPNIMPGDLPTSRDASDNQIGDLTSLFQSIYQSANPLSRKQGKAVMAPNIMFALLSHLQKNPKALGGIGDSLGKTMGTK